MLILWENVSHYNTTEQFFWLLSFIFSISVYLEYLLGQNRTSSGIHMFAKLPAIFKVFV